MPHRASVRRTLSNSLACLMILATLPALSACSVGMAMSGDDNPNVSVLRTGSTRLDVERELGAPRSSRALSDGRLEATYQYELGNEPSAGRAVAHGAMDVLTLGLWEVVGTPIEATQGEEYEVTVVYDANNVVQSVIAADDYGSVSGSQVSTADTSRLEASAINSPTTDGVWILEIGEVTAMNDRDRVRISVQNGRFSTPYETNGWRGQIQGEINEFGTLTATGSASKMAWGSNNLTMKFTSTYSSGGYQEDVLARGRVNATFRVSLKKDMAEVTRATN